MKLRTLFALFLLVSSSLRGWAGINATFSPERNASDVMAVDEEIVLPIAEETDIADGALQPGKSVAVISAQPLTALTDLNTMSQDFILETKQIVVPQYPSAFNPSIIRWKNNLLMTFRLRDPLTNRTDQIGITWLDEEFNPVGTAQILEVNYLFPPQLIAESPNDPTVQDPRLLTVNDDLYMVYSNVVTTMNINISRMFISKIKVEGIFFGENPDILIYYPNMIRDRKEKNWTPFCYGDKLLLAYSLEPLLIFNIIGASSSCSTASSTSMASSSVFQKWYWGILRGGTPALLVDGEYLAFFHSTKGMSTVQSNGESMTHYFMGAYTFSATPPFEITRMSTKPLVHPSFYDGPAYQTWKPLRVIFPCGYVFDDDYIWVSYGKQDNEMWVAKIDKKRLINSLKPTN